MFNRSRSRFSSSARTSFASFARSSSSAGSSASFGSRAGPGLFSSTSGRAGASADFGAGFSRTRSTFSTTLPRNIQRSEKRGLTLAQREFVLDSLGRPLVVSGVVQYGSLTLGEQLEEEEDEEGRVTTSGS